MNSVFIYLVSPRSILGLNLEYIFFIIFLIWQLYYLNFHKLNNIIWLGLWIINILLLTLINYSEVKDIFEILKEIARGFLIFILLNNFKYENNKYKIKVPYIFLAINIIISILQFNEFSSISEMYSQDDLYGRASGVFKYLHSNILFYTLFLLILPVKNFSFTFILIGNILTLSKLALINLFFYRLNVRIILICLLIVIPFLIYLDFYNDDRVLSQLNALINFSESTSFTERRGQIFNYNLYDYIFPRYSPGTIGLNSHRVEITAFNLLITHGIFGFILYCYALFNLLAKNKYLFGILFIMILIGSPIDEPKAIVCAYFLMSYYHVKNK